MLFLLGGLVVAGLFLLAGFDSTPASRAGSLGFDTAEVQRGQMLATNQCASCHLFPEPGIADKLTWALDILPGHTKWLGLEQVDWRTVDEAEQVRAAGVFPDRARVTQAEWRAICAAYLASAPARRLTNTHAPPAVGQLPFRSAGLEYLRATAITTVKVDTETGGIYLGNSLEKRLDLIVPGRGLVGSMSLESSPSSVLVTPEGLYVTTIGDIAPSDAPLGKVLFIGRAQGGQSSPVRLLVEGLRRPMETVVADLNKDGRPDLVIPERGHLLGRLAWHENIGDGTYRPHVLLERSAPMQTRIHDINGDGLPEILVLTAGAREGISIFLNRGKGGFLMLPALEHHPAWGGTGFELADFNRDGHTDILATNGGEPGPGGRAPAPKDYHGVRVYLNNGRNNFTQTAFLPLHGAARAVAGDFDQDGDLDIAAIATFPDYDRPQPLENFVYYRNDGGWMFAPITMPEALRGRWAAMDATDGDGDGDLDIVLGADNSQAGPVPQRLAKLWTEQGAPFIILDNQTARPAAPGGAVPPPAPPSSGGGPLPPEFKYTPPQ